MCLGQDGKLLHYSRSIKQLLFNNEYILLNKHLLLIIPCFKHHYSIAPAKNDCEILRITIPYNYFFCSSRYLEDDAFEPFTIIVRTSLMMLC
jgi:hypothetical protein